MAQTSLVASDKAVLVISFVIFACIIAVELVILIHRKSVCDVRSTINILIHLLGSPQSVNLWDTDQETVSVML